MDRFLKHIREKRKEETENYKAKKYEIDQLYKCYLTFDVLYDNDKFSFSLSCENYEVLFYVIKDKSPLYYSITEIINNLKEINKKHFGILNNLCDKKREIQSSILFKNEKIDVIQLIDLSSFSLTEKQLLILLYLIQDKSNYYLRNTNKYKNGLLRLVNALIVLDGDKDILRNKGWTYNKSTGQYDIDFDGIVYVIVVKFNSRNRKERKEFQGKINTIKKYDELINAFKLEYKTTNKKSIEKEFSPNDNEFMHKLSEFSYNNNLYSAIRKLKQYNQEEKNISETYTKTPIYVGNTAYFVLLIESFEKYKYYLTIDEYNNIIS